MSTKTIKFSAILLVMALFLNGCEKFLDTEPRGVTQQTDFYKTDADAKAAVMAAYDILQSLNANPWQSMWLMKTLLADEIYTGGGKRGDQTAYEELNEFRFGSSNAVILYTFKLSYWGVYRCNKVIDNVLPDTPVKKAIVAEAKTLRALYYFDLVTLWGKVPLVLHELDAANYAQPNAELAALWLQIEKDLNEAIPELPLRSAQSATDKGRASKGTAQALLGKVLLYQKKYADAATQLKNVINSAEYTLNPDYSQILRLSSEFGQESLLEVSYSSDKTYDWGNFNWDAMGRSDENNVHFQLCGPRGDGWFDGGSTGMISGWGFGYPRKSLYDAFVASNDPTRLVSSILTEEVVIAQGGKMRNESVGNTLPIYCEGYVRMKYGPFATETSPGGVRELNYGTNLRLIRYADVLLLAAEACNKSSDDASALLYINDVRNRANLAPLASGGDQLFTDIKNERRLELAFEGQRFQDLVRWGDAATVLATQGSEYPVGDGTMAAVTGAGFKANKNEVLPFPEQEMLVNPVLKQNNY